MRGDRFVWWTMLLVDGGCGWRNKSQLSCYGLQVYRLVSFVTCVWHSCSIHYTPTLQDTGKKREIG